MSYTVSHKQEHSSIEERISKDGYGFYFHSNRWALNKDKEIVFMPDVLQLEPKLLDGFKKTLAIYAEECSASHTLNMYCHFQRFLIGVECLIKKTNTN